MMGVKKSKITIRQVKKALAVTEEKLTAISRSYDESKAVWSRQKDEMLNRISRLRSEVQFLLQEKSNLTEVIEGLGEILGENKSEIKRLKDSINYEQQILTTTNNSNSRY
jgi:peptidoglycan hydrolase CwlO-like protein